METSWWKNVSHNSRWMLLAPSDWGVVNYQILAGIPHFIVKAFIEFKEIHVSLKAADGPPGRRPSEPPLRCCLYWTLMFDPTQGADHSAVRCLQRSSKQSRQPPWWFIYQEWNGAHPIPPSVVQAPVSGYRPPSDQTYYGVGCACVWALIAAERLQ